MCLGLKLDLNNGRSIYIVGSNHRILVGRVRTNNHVGRSTNLSDPVNDPRSSICQCDEAESCTGSKKQMVEDMFNSSTDQIRVFRSSFIISHRQMMIRAELHRSFRLQQFA